METVTIASLIGSAGEVFTKAITWCGTVAGEIVGDPMLLLFCVAVPLCGIGVGMFKRLLHSRG